MKEGIQSFYEAAGKWACLALCIIKIAEEINGQDYDWAVASSKLVKGVDDGFIYYNYKNNTDSKNFDVLDNAGFLKSLLMDKKVDVEFISDQAKIKNWQAKPNQYTVQRWTRPDGKGMEIQHFTRPVWNSLLYSRTVVEGYIDRLTIFTVS
jgi:hypothetical protein